MSAPIERYLGDGVYVHTENGMIALTTDPGTGDTATIFLEGYVFDALCEYVRDTRP